MLLYRRAIWEMIRHNSEVELHGRRLNAYRIWGRRELQYMNEKR